MKYEDIPMNSRVHTAVWYENQQYVVCEAYFTDPITGDVVLGYGVVNKYTGIRECETRRLDIAKVLADGFYAGSLERAAEEAKAQELDKASAPVVPALAKHLN